VCVKREIRYNIHFIIIRRIITSTLLICSLFCHFLLLPPTCFSPSSGILVFGGGKTADRSGLQIPRDCEIPALDDNDIRHRCDRRESYRHVDPRVLPPCPARCTYDAGWMERGGGGGGGPPRPPPRPPPPRGGRPPPPPTRPDPPPRSLREGGSSTYTSRAQRVAVGCPLELRHIFCPKSRRLRGGRTWRPAVLVSIL
jgi:hypothetical protein